MYSNENKKLIECSELAVCYGTRRVLEDLSFSVGQSEVFVVMGGSGCGKTTLLKTIIGLVQPASGSVSLLGNRMDRLDDDEQMAVLAQIGVLFQNGALFGSMTVMENITFPLIERRVMSVKEAQMIAESKLSLVGLRDAGDRYPSELSGGMRKRAAIARCLATDPSVLFFDEPSAGLDPVTARDLDDLILFLKKRLQLTIFVVTHDLESIRLITDRGIILWQGNILAQGTLAEIEERGEERIASFFARVGSKKPQGDSILGLGL